MPEQEVPPFKRDQVLSPGVSRFLALPQAFRDSLLARCGQTWAIDRAYLEEHGLVLTELMDGATLPSGNTIKVNENGHREIVLKLPEAKVNESEIEWRRDG